MKIAKANKMHKPKSINALKKKKTSAVGKAKKLNVTKSPAFNSDADETPQKQEATPRKSKKKVTKPENSVATKALKKVKVDKQSAKPAKSAAKKSKLAKNVKSHKQQLEGLKDIDPEFYEFLKQNDKKLLEFNIYDSDESGEDEEDEHVQQNGKKKHKKQKQTSKEESDDEGEQAEDDEDEDNDGDSDEDDDEKYHKPTGALEVASDESDFEEDAADDDEDVDEELKAGEGTQKITLNLLRQWQMQLERPKVPIDIVRKVIQGFSSALASISGENEAPMAFKVVGSAAFNGMVQLCVLHLQPALVRLLGITSHTTTPLHKTKKWTKVRGCLRYYLTDLIRLIEQVSSANILSVLLKHLHQMAPMIAPFSALGKTTLKRLIVLWATGDEAVRVLAFLCILKITRNQQVSMLSHVLKAMYLSYVRNSKFVSPTTLPAINFMRRSLVEMFALDLNITYQHAFLYIRQLAIHLRNAVILKKKDSLQAVYNWQYMNSLRLWANLLGATADKPQLQPLVYPLVTIALGAIRLIPTAQYFPLRFHCLQALITLAKEANVFIPVLPLILEVLRSDSFNRKHTALSMRPLQFTCILRLNKTQLSENGFRDEVLEQVCALTLEYLSHESASLAFSDLVVPTVVALKAYLKECRNANYSRKVKQLVDKILENSRFIEEERNKITFGLHETAQVQAWETLVRNKRTPLAIYYESWVKTHETKKRRQAAQTDVINADYDVPSIKRKAAKSGGVAIKNADGEVELFPTDSEGEDLDGLPVALVDNEAAPPKAKKAKKLKKAQQEKSNKKKSDAAMNEVDIPVEEPDMDGGVDIVKDLDMDDW